MMLDVSSSHLVTLAQKTGMIVDGGDGNPGCEKKARPRRSM